LIAYGDRVELNGTSLHQSNVNVSTPASKNKRCSTTATEEGSAAST